MQSYLLEILFQILTTAKILKILWWFKIKLICGEKNFSIKLMDKITMKKKNFHHFKQYKRIYPKGLISYHIVIRKNSLICAINITKSIIHIERDNSFKIMNLLTLSKRTVLLKIFIVKPKIDKMSHTIWKQMKIQQTKRLLKNHLWQRRFKIMISFKKWKEWFQMLQLQSKS